MSAREHWNHLYETKASEAVSWFQLEPETSLKLLSAAGLNGTSRVIDVGGGDSRLVDALVDRGVECVTVLDISAEAIARARTRLGSRASGVNWIVADVTSEWSAPPQDFWHDRAVFHFLVEERDRAHYVEHLRRVLAPGGHAIFATFAPDGPTKCSGLAVTRYSAESLHATLGPEFGPVQSLIEPHQTPMGTTQSFLFAVFRKAD
jgi:SAM-dependent methyltransferase